LGVPAVDLTIERPTAPVAADRPASGRLRDTPGRLSVLLVVLLLLGLAAGVTAALGVRDRGALIRGVTVRSGVMAVAAQELYRSLSDADATAASAFLSQGQEPAAARERYQADLARATAALTTVAGAAEGVAAGPIAQITADLPVYTGLVETARAQNRQGLPVGAAYLREASGLMRERILPAAEDLYRAVSTRLAEARADASTFPWIAVSLLVLTALVLGLAQVYLARRTNRVLNPGLVVATVAVVAGALWLSVASVVAARHLEASRRDGSAQVDLLAQARVLTLKARGDEALSLVARGGGAVFEQGYADELYRLTGEEAVGTPPSAGLAVSRGGLLGEAMAQATDDATRSQLFGATEAARAWQEAHGRLRSLESEGRYNEAVKVAIGAEPDGSAARFEDLDQGLAAAIEANSRRFDEAANRAGRSLTGLVYGLSLLTALLVLGAAVGMQRRIAEYQ
jgi:hypothetical protein